MEKTLKRKLEVKGSMTDLKNLIVIGEMTVITDEMRKLAEEAKC